MSPGSAGRRCARPRAPAPLRGSSSEAGVVANDYLRVAVDPTDGTLTLTTTDGVSVRGANRLVESGDGGDTYNYSPPTADFVVDKPEFVHVRTVESGPVRSRILIDALYQLAGARGGRRASCTRRSDEMVLAEVRTYVELRSHERFVRIRVEFDHRVRDHRLRAHFPLPARVAGSDAECAFAVVHRGLTAEGGPHEHGLPTFVSRRFVDASDGQVGLAVLHDGLLEYEVVDGGKELALTLLRATGYLSRAEPSLRPNPAGPLLAVEGAQLQKPIALEYALLPHHGDWEAADLYAAADDFLVPLEHAPAGQDGDGSGLDLGRLSPSGQALSVDGAVVSALLRDAGGVVVRLFNPRATPVEASLHLGDHPANGWIVDFLGAPLESFTETVNLRPAEIVTLRLDLTAKTSTGPAKPGRSRVPQLSIVTAVPARCATSASTRISPGAAVATKRAARFTGPPKTSPPRTTTSPAAIPDAQRREFGIVHERFRDRDRICGAAGDEHRFVADELHEARLALRMRRRRPAPRRCATSRRSASTPASDPSR